MRLESNDVLKYEIQIMCNTSATFVAKTDKKDFIFYYIKEHDRLTIHA